MKKVMLLLLMLSFLPVLHVAGDELEDNRLHVKNTRIESEREKTLGGQLNGTESLFDQEDQQKLTEEKKKAEEQLTAQVGQLFSAIKGKGKTEAEKDLFLPENQKISKFESNSGQENAVTWQEFLPILLVFAVGSAIFGLATFLTYRVYRNEE